MQSTCFIFYFPPLVLKILTPLINRWVLILYDWFIAFIKLSLWVALVSYIEGYIEFGMNIHFKTQTM